MAHLLDMIKSKDPENGAYFAGVDLAWYTCQFCLPKVLLD